jgi:hypothetical protein
LVYYFRERISLFSCDVVERRPNLVISTSHGLLKKKSHRKKSHNKLFPHLLFPEKSVCIIIFALFLTFCFVFSLFVCVFFLSCFCFFDIYSRPWLRTTFDWCLLFFYRRNTYLRYYIEHRHLSILIKQYINMHLAFLFSFFPFIWISNINIWCGQQNHERSTMETGRASA